MRNIYPTAIRRSAFDSFADEIGRLFELASGGVPGARSRSVSSPAWPGVNVWREGDDIVAEAEVPGFTMDSIEVLATGDTLTLRGARESSAPEHGGAVRVERTVRRFDRSLRLPVEIDADNVDATLSYGVLRVTMPVAETARSTRVRVRSLDGSRSREALPSSSTEEAPEIASA